MEPISRRRALQLGGLGAAGTLVGGAGLAQQLGSGSAGAASTGETLREPPVLRSRDGELRVTLEAAEQRLDVAGGPATVLAYDGGLPGPTLQVRPGDVLRVRLVNRLARATNLHVHGLVVSPEGNGDNVFVSVEPGSSFDYAYRLPDDHPPGTYWYHPHRHGSVADQVFAGLYGAIVVEDPDDGVPVARERVLVVSDLTLDGGGRVRSPSAMERMAGREGDLVLVNGQARPVVTAAPGERERWRVVNACTSRYLRPVLDGQRMTLLGVDSGRLRDPREVDEVVLAPGNRADLLVTASTGTALRSLPVDRGGTAMMGAGGGVVSREAVLARLDVTGDPVADLAPVAPRPDSRDLRGADVAARRELVFSMGMGGGTAAGMSFAIDGREFDADRVDQAPAAGTVEEWTLTNTSPMNHPVHLHVWPMQVVSGESGDEAEPTWRDVVDVPARSRVRVRIAFDGFAGRTVYHCHVLDHEDAGMMGVVEVR